MTPQQLIATICLAHGPRVKSPAGIDGAKVLWALAGCESDFGAFALPRHEPAYCNIGRGRYDIPALTRRWGCAAHCSYGPWQMMFCHLVELLPSPLRDPSSYIFPAGDASPKFAAAADYMCAAAVEFLNREVLGRQGATTLAAVAKAWNHGDWRDQFDDSAYTDRAVRFYATPFPPDPSQETPHASAT